MKNRKKTYVWAITLVIAGLLITGALSVPAARFEEKTSLVREIEMTAVSLSQKATKITMTEKLTDDVSPLFDSYIVYDTEYDDYHPTVACDMSNTFFAGMELTTDEVDWVPDFWYSLDNGVTWEEAGYFAESLGAEYPDADSNSVGFYATFSAPPASPGETWVVDASDLNAITGYTVDWSSYNLYDFVYPGISCYDFEGEPWNEGGSAKTGYMGYNSADIDGCPYVNYAMPGDSVAIGWLNNAENYLHADFAIDEITDMSYAVYDNTVEANLLVRKDNFAVRDADGFHAYVGAYDVGDGVNQVQNPSIEANDNNILIVAEVDGDVVCYYSSNGMTSVMQSTVEEDAAFPEIMLNPEGSFVCSYIKGGVIYSEKSDDGATWAEPEVVADNQVNDRFGAHDLGKSVDGVHAVWEDTRNTDLDVYFATVAIAEVPILEITSVVGGLGVTATIKNTGTDAATNVVSEVTVTGGILGLIDKNASATEASLGVDGETTVGTGILFGLGAITIAVTTMCDEGSSDSATVDETQIIIFSSV